MEVRESAWAHKYYRKALVLSVGFSAVLAFCVVIGEVLLGAASHDSAGLSGGLLLTGVVISLVMWPLGVRVRRRMLGEGAGLHAVVDQAMVPQNRYRRMLQAVAASLAISAVPALIGLALVLRGAGRGEFYLFLGGSALLFAIHIPGFGQWQNWFAQRSTFR